jgi:hypothetical protein
MTALRTSGNTSFAANLLGPAVYYVVTVMLYHLYEPVSRAGSLDTALFGFGALTIGVLRASSREPVTIRTSCWSGPWRRSLR